MEKIVSGLLLLACASGLFGIAHGARLDHPSGLGFDYPDGWHPGEQDYFLQLLPPGQAAAAIFASLGGKLALDPALLGGGHRSTTSMTDIDYDGSGGSSYASSSSDYYYSFSADNRVSFQSSSAIHAQGSVGGSDSSASSIGETPGRHGSYAANGNRIIIIWDDGSSLEWDYSVFPHSGSKALKLVDPESGERRFYTPLE